MISTGLAVLATDRLQRRPLRIAVPTLCQIAATVGARPAEFGGMLGAGDDDIVRHFAFDRAATRHGTAYSPDTEALSRIYREAWKPNGIRIVGFVHSHPSGVRRPSGADAEYAARLLAWRPELDRLLLPIVISEPDSGLFEFLPFVALRQGRAACVLPVAVEFHEAEALGSGIDASAPARSGRARRIARAVATAGVGAALTVAALSLTDRFAQPPRGTPSMHGPIMPELVPP